MVSASARAPQLSPERQKELFLFQQALQYSFKSVEILDQALTHSSFANENRDQGFQDNERLEFLGDAVLEYAISRYLYDHYDFNEGECTRIRSSVVSEEALATAASLLDISSFIRVGKGEAATGGPRKKAILADCMEAVFASVSLDSGLEAAQALILRLLVPQIQQVISNKGHKDYKTILQEYVQKRFKKVPSYTMLDHSGPDHDQVFTYKVEFHGFSYGPVQGRNKKEAEQNAARLAVEALDLDKE
ncbi:MAG: ribonuclease III [Sphaerochaetaceae bacterium]|jgi:ribonuclease-3|nr:ribonuclease III [Sphaerochaetaceae bacterium]